MQAKKITIKDKDGNTVTQEFDIPQMLNRVPQPETQEQYNNRTPEDHGRSLDPISETRMFQEGMEYLGQQEQQQPQEVPMQAPAPKMVDEFGLGTLPGEEDAPVIPQATEDAIMSIPQTVPMDTQNAVKSNNEGAITFEGAEDAKNRIEAATQDEQSVTEEQALNEVNDEDQKKAGEDVVKENPGFFDRVVTSLGNAFDNLLNDDQLAEAAVMYLGSRALGYSHGGSLRWTGKNYLQQQMSHKNAVQQLHLEGKHTDESIEKFKESRNTKDLEPIQVSNVKIDRTSPTVGQIKGSDKQIKLYPAENKNGDKIFVDGKGNPIDTDKVETDQYKVKGSKQYNERLLTSRNAAADQLKELQKQFGTFGEGEDKGTFTDLNPSTAAAQVGRWATESGIDPNEVGVLTAQAYEDMRNYANATKKRPRDIKPFLNQLVIRNRVGTPELFEAKGSTAENPQWVEASKLALVNNAIGDIMKKQGASGNVNDIANLFYTKKVKEWTDTLTQEQRDAYTGSANGNESGFYLFIVDKLGIDHRIQK